MTDITTTNNQIKKRCVNASGGPNKNKHDIRGHYRTGDVNSGVELPMHPIPGTDPTLYRCEDCHIRETVLVQWFRKLPVPDNKAQMQDSLGRIATKYYWQYLNIQTAEDRDPAPRLPRIFHGDWIDDDEKRKYV